MTSCEKYLSLGNKTLAASAATLALCVAIAYPYASAFSIAAQILAHLAITVSAGFFKLGYVLRLAAQHEMNKQAGATAGTLHWQGA